MKTKLNLCLLALVIGLAFLLQNCEDDDTIVQYTLTTDVTPALSGSVAPSSGTFDEGTVISLTATPASEYVFKNWSNGASGTENPLSVIMASDKNITAVFEKKNYSLNIVIVGEGTVAEEIIQAKSAGDYPSGTIVRLTAVPSAEWEFVEWSGDYDGTENPLQVTIDEPINLTAKFEKKNYYSLWIITEGEGTLNLEIIQGERKTGDIPLYSAGTIVKLTAIPSAGYYFLGWMGAYNGTENPIQITIDKPTNLTAFFAELSPIKTYIPDDKFEQALIDLGYDDVLDDYVNTANINEILKLDISDKGITDLTGIEDFVGLYELNCSSNQLSSLDVSSNNLAILGCYSNQLSFLNLSPSIIYMNCSNNQLTSLDVSSNVNMLTLACSNNQLTSLDISNSPLDILDCTNNLLTCIQVNYEQFSDISIFWKKDDSASYSLSCNTSSNKTYVPDDNFEQALINLGYDDVLDDYVNTNIIDKITELYISGKGIKDLTGIEDFVGLEILHCENNLLTSLDLSNNTKLEFFDCENNLLTSLNVSNLVNLTAFDCPNNQLASIDISDNIKLRGLYCPNNKLTSLDISNNPMLGTESPYNFLDCTNNPLLECIQISEQQLLGIDPLIYFWIKDDIATYSLDCNY